nr:SpaH/EbpB family LPXTG-anchored major pilin [uncultured Blautia sp.]
MKNLFKKISAILMAAIMVLAMASTAFAAKVTDKYTNKITVTNLAADVETTLKLYNIIYLDQNNAGNQTWQVVEWAKKYISEDTVTGNFNITDSAGLKAAADSRNADVTEKETGTTHEFSNLPIGAYVICASDVKGVYSLMVANTYDKDGETYMADKAADVVAKMESYNVTKQTEDKFVHRGQRVNFTVTTQMASKTKANGDTLTTFKVVDTSTGLKADSFVLDSVKIAGQKVNVDKTKVTSITGNDGKVTYTVDLSDFISTTDAGTTIEVKYSAIVENDHTYNNSATVNSNTVNYVPGIVNGYTGNVTLEKVDTNGKTLNGAEFQLLKVTPVEKEGAEATKTPVNVVRVNDGEYKVALEGETGATTTLVATNGTLKVTGLDEGDYEFEETKAPTGYKVSSENKAFTITPDETKEVSVDAGVFKNTKLSALPSTGGMGTYLFTIIGVVVMAGAAGAFFISRRKGSEE